MKLLALCATGLSLMLSFTSCTNNKHLISDAAERNAVQQDFETDVQSCRTETCFRCSNNR